MDFELIQQFTNFRMPKPATSSGHLQKNVNRKNFQAETQAQLFGHHTMTAESFYVDAFRAREETGALTCDVLQYTVYCSTRSRVDTKLFISS